MFIFTNFKHANGKRSYFIQDYLKSDTTIIETLIIFLDSTQYT